jgi:hypothetical protein
MPQYSTERCSDFGDSRRIELAQEQALDAGIPLDHLRRLAERACIVVSSGGMVGPRFAPTHMAEGEEKPSAWVAIVRKPQQSTWDPQVGRQLAQGHIWRYGRTQRNPYGVSRGVNCPLVHWGKYWRTTRTTPSSKPSSDRWSCRHSTLLV